MPQSLANFDGALKDDYGPGLREAVNYSNVVWSEITKNTEDIQGRQAVWSVHIGESTSTGARGELAPLPTADRNTFQQVRDNLAFLYHTIKVSGPAEALTKGDAGSFTRALESELKFGEKSLKKDCARQSFNAAVSISGTLYLGSLTEDASTASADTGELTFGNADLAELRYFFRREAIDVIYGSTGLSRGSTAVTAITTSTGRIEFSPTVAGTASGDYIARQGNFQPATTLGGELNGLRHLISDDLYANVDPATVPEWGAIEFGDGTDEISEILLDQANQKVELDGDGDSPDLWLASKPQVSKLASLLQVQKRYDGKQMKLKAGWTGLQISQGVLVEDRFNPDNKIFGICKSEIARFVGLDFTWDDLGGTSVFYKALDGSDAVEARFKAYQNLNVTNRNSHVVIDLAVPVL